MQRPVVVVQPKTSYREADLLDAVGRLGLRALRASDRCHQLDVANGAVALDFTDPARAGRALAEHVRAEEPLLVLGSDETTALIASHASAALGLGHAAPDALAATRDKLLFREAMERAGQPGPAFRRVDRTLGGRGLDALAAGLTYPCVVKPRTLSGSRGVIRADSPASFREAFARVARLLASAELRARRDPALDSVLIEAFVPGPEVALEGLLTDGRLDVLALFDKPDPLDGPFFEETLYVAPSRHPAARQKAVASAVEAAAGALGLRDGPVHAEVRLARGGPVVIELAARSIGGLCGRVLRFGVGVSLEELVLRHAVARATGVKVVLPPRESKAAGVLMLPIRAGGVLRRVRGVERARLLPLIDGVEITARPDEELVPLPEGARYLGFAFAHGDTPEAVERALRAADGLLAAELARKLPVAR